MLHIVFFQHGFNVFFIDAVEPDTGIIDFFFILQSLADIERAVIQQMYTVLTIYFVMVSTVCFRNRKSLALTSNETILFTPFPHYKAELHEKSTDCDESVLCSIA